MEGNQTGMMKVLALVATFVMLATLPAPDVEAISNKKQTRIVADGVKYRLHRLPGPIKVRVVTFSPSSAPTIDTVLAGNKLPGFERTSSMARRTGALVAINGDYARPTGRPVFTFARDGKLDQTPAVDPHSGNFNFGRNFSMDVNEQAAYFDHPQTKAWVSHTKLGPGASYEVQRINDGASAASHLLRAYTSAGGSSEKPPRGGCYVRLRPHRSPESTSATTAPFSGTKQIASVGVERVHVVEKARCGWQRVYPKGGTVLFAPKSGYYELALRAMLVGDEVTYGWSLGWPDVFETIGGNPTLIEDGRVQWSSVDDGSSFASHRHPRTAVAYDSRNGEIFFVTVDGRQKRYSVGMTLGGLSRFLRDRLGATDALNLDGGGSTTMVVDGQIKGRPSDGSERGVSSSLVIRGGGHVSRKSQSYAGRPSLPVAPDDNAFEEMVEDPASVGGLSVYLERRDHELPGFLDRTADHFRSTR